MRQVPARILPSFRSIGRPPVGILAELPAGSALNLLRASVISSRTALQIEQQPAHNTVHGPAGFVFRSTGTPYIIALTEKWTLAPAHLVAWTGDLERTTMSGPGDMILDAQGGLFQVDVAEGQKFVVEGSSLVAHTGPAPSRVHHETKLEVLAAMGRWAADGLKGIYSTVYDGVSKTKSLFSASGTKSSGANTLDVAQGSEATAKKGASGAVRDSFSRDVPAIRKSRDVTVVLLRDRLRVWGAVIARWFGKAWDFSSGLLEKQKPVNLSFKGPCTVLVRQ